MIPVPVPNLDYNPLLNLEFSPGEVNAIAELSPKYAMITPD